MKDPALLWAVEHTVTMFGGDCAGARVAVLARKAASQLPPDAAADLFHTRDGVDHPRYAWLLDASGDVALPGGL